MTLGRGLAIAALLSAASALAEAEGADRALDAVRSLYDVGNYKDALAKARDVMVSQNFNDEQRVELHKFAALSAFNLGDAPGAKDHFLKLLQLNPDYVLDPFSVAPSAVNFFEQLKRDNADMLNLVRQQIRIRDEEREKQRIADEESRRKLEAMAKRVTVRTVEKRYYLVNFLPFGAGQFQQGRTSWGVGFAVTEGVLAATSIISYLAINGLIHDLKYLPTDLIEPGPTLDQRGIDPKDVAQDEVWRWLKWTSSAGFYLLYGLGVADAVVHHEDEVATEQVIDVEPAPAQPAPAPSPKKTPSKLPVKPRGSVDTSQPASQGASVQPLLFPTAGGIGAGLRIRF